MGHILVVADLFDNNPCCDPKGECFGGTARIAS